MSKYIASGRNGANRSVYHINEDCRGLKDSNPREVTENELRYFDLRLCQYCDPDVKQNNPRDQDKSYYKALKEAAEQ